MAFWDKPGIPVVDIRWEESDAEEAAFEGVGEEGVEALAVGEDSGEEIGGVVGLHPGGLPGFEGVSGRVGAAEGVAAESVDEFPDRPDFLLCAAVAAGEIAEFAPHFLDFGVLHLHQCAAEDIRASGGHGGKGVGDLEDVLLVGDDPVGGAQAGFERGVGE